jgi:UDP-N-acetylmuramoyl-tripeptide--D-alanyl-D-alanine ligase
MNIVRTIGRHGLQASARLYRRLLLRRPVFIAITGSCGKTTTKELAAAVLSSRMRGTRGAGNGNTPWHLVRNVLRTRPSDEYSLQELAGFHEAAIPLEGPLDLIRPTIGVVTNIGGDHYTVFRDLDATAAHKGKLIAALPADGVAILNADDPRVLGMKSRCRGRVVTFGSLHPADVSASRVSCEWPERLSLDVSCGGETTRVQTRLCAPHLVPDVLAAIAVGHVMGIPLSAAAAAIGRVEPFPGRMSPVTTSDGITFMRDDQKAPMWTIPATIDFLRSARARRKIVVLGTLSDFPGNPGRKSARVTRDLLEIVDAVIGVGPQGSFCLRASSRHDGRVLRAFRDQREALRFLRDFLEPGDLVVLKGSEADQLDMIVRQWQPRDAGQTSGLRPQEDVVLPVAGEYARLLVVGLGNPEPAYADTPHNIGQRAVDLLAERLGATWEAGDDGLTAVTSWGEVTLHLAKLHVHVNDTGEQLRRLTARHGISPECCIAVLDDVHLEAGVVRRREHGSSGGHNGMASIITAFQTQAIRRVKIGVGPVDGNVAAFVLRRFSEEQTPVMARACEAAVDIVLQMVTPPRARGRR